MMMTSIDFKALKELQTRATNSGDLESRIRAQELLVTQLMLNMTEISTVLKNYEEVQTMTRANHQIISAIKWGALAIIGSALSVVGTVGVYQILGAMPK